MQTQIGILRSVQVGRPERHTTRVTKDGTERSWRTSFFREPDPRPRWLYATYLEGNEQADKQNHGSPGQAVLLYAASHYPAWWEELGRPEMGPGGFGENFTVEGLTEESACIGDIYELGNAQIQVTGPRYPCSKIEKRWNLPGLTARVAETGRTGWYCSVVREGLIEPGIPLMLVERPYPQWTIALINDFAHFRSGDMETAKALAACPLLDEFWAPLIVRNARKQQRTVD